MLRSKRKVHFFVLAGLDPGIQCAEHARQLGGVSPLSSLMERRISEAQERRREAGFEGSVEQSRDPRDKNRMTRLVRPDERAGNHEVQTIKDLPHGQTHGGIAQGAGQALFEQCVYDAGSGQLISGSFMDYALPRAADLPFFATAITEVRPRPTRWGLAAAAKAALPRRSASSSMPSSTGWTISASPIWRCPSRRSACDVPSAASLAHSRRCDAPILLANISAFCYLVCVLEI